MRADALGLYVHIPICLKKCNYCDFCSFAALSDAVRKGYIRRLAEEISGYKREPKILLDTVFFGGGTPSLLSPLEFECIYSAITDSFDICDGAEITLECNPKTLTQEKLMAYKSSGVNRISIGLQSIHENELKILGRIHNFEDFKAAYRMVSESGITNINIDVMYGIPEQTKESFEKTLSSVLDFNPSHISAYGLILEEGTSLWNLRDSLSFPSEDDECDMYALACRMLSERGYLHYEISNYARSGSESRHNLKYWKNREFIGVGVSAYSYFDGKRFGNTRELSEYMSENSAEYISEEAVDINDSAYNHIMLGLRLKEGISLSEYRTLYGEDFLSGREAKIRSFVGLGYMKIEDGRLHLTEKGFYVSNTILTELI